MIRIKNKKEIQGIKASCRLLTTCFMEMAEHVIEGNNGLALNQWAEDFARKYGANPSFRTYAGFPTAMCISVNNAVIHGIPTHAQFKEGDIVSIDFGLELHGFFSDMAVTFAITNVTDTTQKLLYDTQQSLSIGINAIQPQTGRIHDIGKAISGFLKPKGYGVVYDFCGHGVGLAVHEEPQISHDYPSFGSNPYFKEGMVLAIEPMVTLGSPEVYISKQDKWTVYTKDKSLAAHFEHTIAVTENGVEILTCLP